MDGARPKGCPKKTGVAGLEYSLDYNKDPYLARKHRLWGSELLSRQKKANPTGEKANPIISG